MVWEFCEYKYSAFRNKNNTWLNLWFANEPPNLQMVRSIPNLETISWIYCSALVLCKEVSPRGGKEWDLPVAPASKVSEGKNDFCYQGSCINSSPKSYCMFFCNAQAAAPFLWQFPDSCSCQAGCLRPTGAVAFFRCQTANDSGLETNLQLFFSHLGTCPFHLCNKTPGFSRGDGHKLFTCCLWVPSCSCLWALCALRAASSCVCKRGCSCPPTVQHRTVLCSVGDKGSILGGRMSNKHIRLSQ